MAEEKETAEDKAKPKKAQPEQATEANEEGSENKKMGSKKLIIIAAISLLVLSSLTVTTVLLFMGGDNEPAAQAGAGEVTEESEQVAENDGEASSEEGNGASATGSPKFYPIRPAFVVNIPSKGRIRFLQIQVDVMSRDDDVIDDVETYEPLIKNELVSLFSTQTYEGVITPEGKERLRKEALARVQKVMRDQAGVEGIEQILFTSFVTQ